MEKEIVYTLQEVEQVANNLIPFILKNKIMVITGDLGAGKTTLITSICKQLEVIDQVSSPTFSIVNEYETHSHEKIYHLDLYRLNDVEEAINIGIEDYIYSHNITFIEWPEIIENLLPMNLLRIHLENLDNSTRKLLFL